jgi:uncharacterized protein (TIGR00288 family)
MAIHPSANAHSNGLARVAVLVDCDNMPADSLRFALRAMAQFGRIVVRRGYGNHATLTAKWRESLVEYAFTPHLQFQYAAGKNTADIAMAIDAVELLFDDRADAYCLVTSDSDFSYLCRRLRERGSNVFIVGERRTPQALRNASDQFFELELLRQEYADPAAEAAGAAEAKSQSGAAGPSKAALLAQRAAEIIAGLALLAEESDDGWVSLTALNSYIRRTDPGFDTKRYGFKRFLDMVQAQPRLETRLTGSVWLVRARAAAAPEAEKKVVAEAVAAVSAPAPVVVAETPSIPAKSGRNSRSRRGKAAEPAAVAVVEEGPAAAVLSVPAAASTPAPAPTVVADVMAPKTGNTRRRGRERLRAEADKVAVVSTPAPEKVAASTDQASSAKPVKATTAKSPARRKRTSKTGSGSGDAA